MNEKPKIQLGESVPLTGQPIEWVADETPSFYANVVAMSISPFDFTLMFGQLQSATKESANAKQCVKVTIPPEIAAILNHVLKLGVEQYQANNGPLRSSADFLKEDRSSEG